MAKSDKDNLNLTPAAALHKRLDDMINAGMKKTREWATIWQQALRYFFSDQMRARKKQKNWDWVEINYIWPSAIQETAKLSKNQAKILASPRDQGDVEVADVWQGVLQYNWEYSLNMRLQQIMAVFDGKMYGYRVSKWFWEEHDEWDDDHKEWIGDVKHKLLHPRTFWVDPHAELLSEASSLGTRRLVPLDWALIRWPKHRSAIIAEADKAPGMDVTATFGADWNVTDSTGREKKTTGLPTALLTLIQQQDAMISRPSREPDAEKMVLLDEIYFLDHEEFDGREVEDVPAEELVQAGTLVEQEGVFFRADTGEVMPRAEWPQRVVREWREPKYPNGRFILRIGQTILNPDEESQKYPYRRWPFVVTPHYLLPHMWQGINAVDMVKSTQDMINVSASYLVNNMKMYGAPHYKVESGALVKNPKTGKAYRILAAAGSVIRVARGMIDKVKRVEPASVSQGAILLYNLLTQEYKNISGLQSIARGEQAKSRTTATEASVLAVSANDRIALQSVYEDEWIKGCARLMAEICQANYDVSRFVRIVGEDKTFGAQQITQAAKKVKFDIIIVPGITLPFDEEKRIARYTAAYQMVGEPIANPMLPEMLRILEIAEWKKILEKHEPWLVFVQFQQMMQGVQEGEIEPQEAVAQLAQQINAVVPAEEEEKEEGASA